MTPEINCAGWRKSSRSGGTNGNCVELATTLGMARDSKNPATVLTVPLAAMLAVVKAGYVDR